MREVTLTKAELKMLKESGGSIKATLRSLQARTGINLPEAKGVIEAAKEALRKAEAPTRPPPVDDNEDEVLRKPPVEKPSEWPDSRLILQAKSSGHTRRVTVTEVYEDMAEGEADRGALTDAITSVLRWGVPLTIQLGAEGKTVSGREKTGRRIRISRK